MIDKEKQIEETTELLWHFPKALHLNCYDDCYEVAQLLYEEDYRKQRKGEWMQDFDGDYYCPFCAHYPKEIGYYCPNCGAKIKDASDMVVKFPAECSKKNCSHFSCWESGIAEITCHCDLCEADADADCEILLDCPLLVKGGE